MTSHSSTSSSSRTGALRFTAECALFGVLLVALHAVAYAARGPRDFPAELAALDRAITENQADILYVGDSTLFMGQLGESDARSTPAMLQELLDDRVIAEISGPAMLIEAYDLFAQYLSRRDSSIRTVIVPLNLRMLAPQLEQHSYRYFDQERAFVEHDSTLFRILYRPLAIFKTFDHRSPSRDEFVNAPVYDGAASLGPLGEFNPNESVPVSEEQRARIIQFSYMYSLKPDSPALARMRSLIEALQLAGIEVLFYVTPIDYEACERDLGVRFTERLRENVAVLQDLCADAGVVCLDLSTEVPSRDFAWEHYPNEHLNADGRKYIAERLAAALRTPESPLL